MNDDPNFYSDHKDNEELYDGSYERDGACEEYYTSHSELRGNVSNYPLIYKSYESHGKSAHMGYKDSYSLPCMTSYQIRSGVIGYTNYSRGCFIGPKECASPKSRDVTSQDSCSSAQIFRNGTQGRYGQYSRSQDLCTLSIFIREPSLKEYVDWEWECERIFMDYEMSKVERAMCALKHIQGPTLLWWEYKRKPDRTWSA